MARSAGLRHRAAMRHLALLAALATAATTPAASTTPAALGQHQRVGRYVVTPVQIDEDSRCPMNARCVWAGRVTVSAVVFDGRKHLVRHYTLGEPAWPGIVLDSVTPERVAGSTPRGYRVHFSPSR